MENKCADSLANNGYRVHQNPTSQEFAEALRKTGDIGNPRKAPDYLIEGYVFDCYSPTPKVAPRAIWSTVEKKVKRNQTQRVVLNLHDWHGDINTLDKQFNDWPIPELKELAAVTRNGTIVQIFLRD